MFYVKNVPGWERVVRIILGIAGAVLSVIFWKGIIGVVGVVAAIGIVFSGVVGFCPACALVGRRLNKQAKL
ncbi:YgaP family membrane protein [Paraburkholderia sp. MM6662-R1]|uniref:YgaP family membrane protein n=1 Tax=Paraburkholderia sp. MM6662-R1 TaxID=2991066 RepID=UPI003D22F2B6